MDENQNEIKSRVENYKDLEGVTTKQLDFGLWFIKNKNNFRLILIYLLSIIAAVSWLISLYSFTYYIFWGMKQDERLVGQMVETNAVNHNYTLQKSAQNLTFSNVDVIRSTSNAYDFLVKINNSNADWWGEFDYYFLVDDRKTDESKNFILPGETKYLTAFNQNYGLGGGVRLMIENMRWQRIDKHKIHDWRQYKKDHLNIAVKDIQFTAVDGNSSGNLNQLSFTAINQAAYNYKTVDFIVILSNGSRTVGANRYTFNDFLSNEERQFRGNWTGNYGRVQVEIIPEVNIMDEENYKKFEL